MECMEIDDNTMRVHEDGDKVYEFMFFPNDMLVVVPESISNFDEISATLCEHSHVRRVVKHPLAEKREF